MDAAARLFTSKGYAGTTMDDVALEAGVAKGSLYYHFKNKSQLFCETVVSGLDWFEERMIAITNGNGTAAEIAGELISMMVHLVVENSTVADMVMMELTDGVDDGAAKEVMDAKEHLTAALANVIRDGATYGLLRPCDSQRTTRGIIAYIYYYCRGGVADVDAAARNITAQLLRGMID